MEADFYMTPDRPRELISCSVIFPDIENLSVCLRHSLILLDRRVGKGGGRYFLYDAHEGPILGTYLFL